MIDVWNPRCCKTSTHTPITCNGLGVCQIVEKRRLRQEICKLAKLFAARIDVDED